ncbi:cell wall anchored protein [Diplodia corticola]|uniref:Cell wall anchored protein n=1 Tax=Diplodia corticola TaxID=236234 RepID=A0A1J9RTZ7_9PEZI|nr:cell wall anchored protein [Diplodia corticola]OJD30981.1 cell wall anchored protein [Diplodia corticola]
MLIQSQTDARAGIMQATMVRRDSIFLDGGVQTLRSNNTTSLTFSKYIYELDVGKSWDVNTNFTESRIGRYAGTDTNANPPNMLRGALYAANRETNKLFTFGGSSFLANDSDPDWEPPSQDATSLWSYDTEIRDWHSYNITTIPWRPNWGAVAEDIVHDIGFFLNGQYDRGSSYGLYTSVEYEGGKVSNASFDEIRYLGGLIMIDLHTQETRNLSTESLGAPRVAGGLVYSPTFGKTANGTLLAFGGMRSSGQSVDTFTNGDLIDMTTISLCDSFMDENVTWFNQSTTGDTPPPRMDFCTLPFEKDAKDNSSINIYIHGGYDPGTSTLYDDMYILSVPSFTWTKVYSGTDGRFGHSCNAAGLRQMVVTGGARDASLYAVETTGAVPDLDATTCNDGLGVSLFDLTNLTWGTFFDHDAPAYQVPQKVVDVIGGSPDGAATMTQPANGFAHPAIYTMFHPPPTPTTTTTSSSSTTTPSASTITGAAIGSIAGAALLLTAVIWLVLRRRKRRRRRLQRESERCRASSVGTGTTAISELQGGQPVEVHEKAAAMPLGAVDEEEPEPQELEAAERVELPAADETVLREKEGGGGGGTGRDG